jgi:bla regulator protein blaR1
MRFAIRCATLAFAITILNAPLCPAQADADTDLLKFEVASIKPTGPNRGSFQFFFLPGGKLRATGVTVSMLIVEAYDVRPFQISGPKWLTQDTFSILATPPDPARASKPILDFYLNAKAKEEDQHRARLQSLLADRFQLKVHRETREQQVYALVIAKGGAKVKAAQPGGALPPGFVMRRGQITGTSIALSYLVKALAGMLDRAVVNETGLDADYDFKLDWNPDAEAPPSLDGAGSSLGSSRPAQEGLSIFSALQDQLGLKLEPRKEPVNLVIVDKVERPSPN